ncbi:DUF1648 domain-containing protein [Streptomyces sp. NPDC051310]|uniref:DUF1648 domain-containing protein n=1 Tax=Streptomyces sp. NPDC051310 TaxID=3365649 RepID=UPI0037A3F7A5
MVFRRPLLPWFLLNAVLLAVLAIRGTLRYPHLPDRIPERIGLDGVDAWTGRSIGSAFALVFLYAGVTVLITVCAEMTLRVTPRDELHGEAVPSAAGRAPSSLVVRPAGLGAARRIARAVLVLDACIGISPLFGCGVLWRSTPEAEVPVWLFAALVLPPLAGTVLTVAAAATGRKR